MSVNKRFFFKSVCLDEARGVSESNPLISYIIEIKIKILNLNFFFGPLKVGEKLFSTINCVNYDRVVSSVILTQKTFVLANKRDNNN